MPRGKQVRPDPMCGIAGVFHYLQEDAPDRSLVERMTRVIAHRGPDDEGVVMLGPCGIGNRRLSIIDLTTGHMPMANEDDSVWITFNGEIYNYRELREPLVAKGHRFRTRSDTEVILHHYLEHGPDGCREWNGMFGVAIFDVRARRLFLARDHFGVKPLYYYDDGRRLLFGSELKAILEDPSVPRELDREALDAFLTLRFLPSPYTLLAGIRKVPPGHYLLVDKTGVTVHPYFTDVPVLDHALSEEQIIEEYLPLLARAVKRQMVSDVPVGLMLSGGVDSAALAYYMMKAGEGRIRTFSVGFRGSGDWNELDHAAQTASWAGTDHHPLLIEKDEYTDFFPKSFWYLEEPISEPTISAYYHVCRLAAGQVKVVLMGQGADEPLAGYDRYFGERYHRAVASILAATPLKALIERVPRLEKMKMSVRSLAEPDTVERFVKIMTVFQPDWQRALRKDSADGQHDVRRAAREIVSGLQKRVADLPSLAQLLYIDARTMLADNLLLFGDKIAMANSLEVRVPYLDLDLVRFIESVPPEFKIRGLSRKYFHRKALARILPREFVNRKKRGFATPMDRWFRRELQGEVRKVLLHPQAAVADVFRQDTIARLLDMHVAGRENFRKQIYLLLSYEFWAQRFLKGRSVTFADYH
ncbi:MAG: asparagine synthase (glutamine-hydrolyzing) [bacterium]|nr:asparagine synthase (glutamine-hydrolyzing) [bacterium]